MQEQRVNILEIKQRIAGGDDDLVVEATTIIPVHISIERAHRTNQDQQLGGYLVTLGFPAQTVQAESEGKNEPMRLVADLVSLEEPDEELALDDVVTTLGIDCSARIWTLQSAP